MTIFQKTFEAGWRDVDPNGHLANTSYMEYAVNTRIAYFASCGFPPGEFQRSGFGPVIKSDLIEYFREILMLETFSVTMESGGLSDDCSRFRIVNTIYKEGEILSARITTIGGWLGFEKRKLIEPPAIIKEAMNSLRQTDDFEILKSSLK
jgi:acyl-CoA thioester hydrolase